MPNEWGSLANKPPTHRSAPAVLVRNRDPVDCGDIKCLAGDGPKTQRKIWLL